MSDTVKKAREWLRKHGIADVDSPEAIICDLLTIVDRQKRLCQEIADADIGSDKLRAGPDLNDDSWCYLPWWAIDRVRYEVKEDGV